MTTQVEMGGTGLEPVTPSLSIPGRCVLVSAYVTNSLLIRAFRCCLL
jgi:hypothetical protein